LTFIILCTLISTDIKAQNDSAFMYFNQLIMSGDTNEALVELERIIYVNEDNSAQAIFNKGILYKQQQEFILAQKCFERVNFETLTDSQHYQFRYQAALMAYLAGNYSDAEAQILQIKYYLHDSSFYYQIIPLYALNLIEMQRWDESKALLQNYIVFSYSNTKSEKKDSLFAVLNQIYNKKNIPKLLKVKKAQVMSAILPGLGQLYAGYFLESLANFSFSLSSLALGGYAFYKKYYFTGYFVGLGLFQKFYFGGQKRTEILVIKRNELKTRIFNNQVKSFILSI